MSAPHSYPRLDCHAHLAPDVTGPQIAALGGAVIFAMTRTPAEARAAARRSDKTILWGYGAHPGLKLAVAEVDAQHVRRAIDDHIIIGEVGLDRATALGPQQAALDTILQTCAGQSVLISLHSTGRTAEIVSTLTRHPHPGAILHWFNSTPDQIDQAAALGCYFSINAAMSDERISRIPTERLLPETDFPSSRRSTHAKTPGDIDYLEQRLANLTGQAPDQIRAMWYRNLGDLARRSGAITRMPIGTRALLGPA
ncbi:TatD family hydrolase [Phytohabitans suffuscus]|uniref:TatD family hydrolase n=1 Tax=Phytohabitans suffuscus TaxID=624315 RepID=A0A6F8YJ27_9ACTN|nr:TatD family hydrolase [Phytohabitans suffuscus]BCB86077.1 TatD family hydrolase [Phytohabitans suffuscus]